jgi:hypothetical protein
MFWVSFSAIGKRSRSFHIFSFFTIRQLAAQLKRRALTPLV